MYGNENLFSGKGDLVGCDIDERQFQSNGVGPEFPIKSSGDVKALTYCDLKCIHMQGLVEVLRLYPEFQQEFLREFFHDLTYNLREGYEAEVSLLVRLYNFSFLTWIQLER